MFTGIIETIGTVSSAKRAGGDLRLLIAAPDFKDKQIVIGDSVACAGVCLTVVAIQGDQLAFDVSIESLDHSLIGDWTVGSRVNLELAMLPSTRFGGHLVSGHVDGLATLTSLQNDARSWRMGFTVPANLQHYIAKKGSITINGVSLTVNSVENNLFDINVIPHTFEVTTLGKLKVNDQVHIEVDLIARYLERLLTGKSTDIKDAEAPSTLSSAFLAEHGFA